MRFVVRFFVVEVALEIGFARRRAMMRATYCEKSCSVGAKVRAALALGARARGCVGGDLQTEAGEREM